MAGGILPPILGELQLSASEFIDKLAEVRDVLGETAGSTDDLDLAQARAEATSSQLADAQERLAATSADLIATQDAINKGQITGEEASTAQSGALDRQAVAEKEMRDATLANADAQGKLAEAEVASADTGVLQDERLIKAGKLVTLAFLGIGAAVGVMSVKMAMDFQTSQAKVQAALGQSTKQSNDLANALLGTAGTTEQSANAMEAALAPVAAQFKSLQGGAYTTADALAEMKAATSLADAGLGSLSDTTGDLAGVMQAFQLRAKDAASTADILYSASQITGQGIDSLTSGLERTRTKLGALAPSLGQLSGLLVDMTEHGETGRAAMSMLTTTMTALLKPAADAAKAQDQIRVATAALPPALRSAAAAYESGALTGKDLTATTDAMSASQGVLWKAFTSAVDGAKSATLANRELGLTVETSKGQFVGWGSIISQLAEKTKGMTTAQATAELTALGFGSASAKVLALVRAGPEAFDKATAAVTKHGTAENAANLQMKTLHGQLHMLEAAVDDYGVRLGRVLIPKIETVIHVTASVVEWFNKNRVAAYTLAAVVVGVLGVAVTAFAVNALGKLVANAQSAYQAVLKLFGLKGGPDETSALNTDASQASETLQQGIAKAGEQLIADAKTAAASLTAGGSTAAEDLGTGGATAAEDLGAGGATAAEDLGAGGATAAEDLGAGGAAAAEDVGAGGAAAAEDLGAGGAAAAEDVGAGGASAAEDLGAGGASAAEDLGAGGAGAAEDLAAGGETASEDLVAGGAGAAEDVAAGGATAGEDLGAGGEDAAEAAGAAGAGAGLALGGGAAAGAGAAGAGEAGGFSAVSLILPVITAQIASLGTKLIPGAAAGEAAMPSWMKDVSLIPFVGAIPKIGADLAGGFLDAIGALPKTVPSEKQIAANAALGSYDTGRSDIELTKAQKDQVVGLMKMGESLKEAQQKVLGIKTSTDKTTIAVNSLGSKLAKTPDIAAVTAATLKLAKPVDIAKVTTAVNTATTAVKSVKSSVDAGHTVNVSGDLHTTVVLDGRTLATAVQKYMLRGARATGQNVLNSRSVGRGTGNP
jgi:hypothetical protein